MKRSVLILFLGIFLFSLGCGSATPVVGSETTHTFISGNFTCNSSASGATMPFAYFVNTSNPASSQIIWVYNATYSSGNCSLASPTIPQCCPGGYSCVSGRCVSGATPGCGAINTSAECNTLSNFTIESGIAAYNYFDPHALYVGECESDGTMRIIGSPSGDCRNVSQCACKWYPDTAQPNGGTCGGTRDFSTIGTTCSSTGGGSCDLSFDRKDDSCNSAGKITIYYTATEIGSYGGVCSNSTLEYPCSATVTLPFFSLFNMFSTILGLTLVYFLLNKKKHG